MACTILIFSLNVKNMDSGVLSFVLLHLIIIIIKVL